MEDLVLPYSIVSVMTDDLGYRVDHHEGSTKDQRGICYDMEVGENHVRIFYGTEKREGTEKDSRYMDETPAPAAVTNPRAPAHVHL